MQCSLHYHLFKNNMVVYKDHGEIFRNEGKGKQYCKHQRYKSLSLWSTPHEVIFEISGRRKPRNAPLAIR